MHYVLRTTSKLTDSKGADQSEAFRRPEADTTTMTAKKRRSLVLWRRAAGGKEGRTKNTQNKDKAGKDGAWYYDGEQQKEQEWNEEKVGRRRRRTRTKKTHEHMQDNVGGEEQFRDFEFILKTSWLYCKVPPKQVKKIY